MTVVFDQTQYFSSDFVGRVVFLK
ncbi:MAG: hypothetical protein RLZZ519_2921, partial [Bacteroidota bacterium]